MRAYTQAAAKISPHSFLLQSFAVQCCLGAVLQSVLTNLAAQPQQGMEGMTPGTLHTGGCSGFTWIEEPRSLRLTQSCVMEDQHIVHQLEANKAHQPVNELLLVHLFGHARSCQDLQASCAGLQGHQNLPLLLCILLQ